MIKQLATVMLALTILQACASPSTAAADPQPLTLTGSDLSHCQIVIYRDDNDEDIKAAVQVIDSAKKSIFVRSSLIGRRDVSRALEDALLRGVSVTNLISQYEEGSFFRYRRFATPFGVSMVIGSTPESLARYSRLGSVILIDDHTLLRSTTHSLYIVTGAPKLMAEYKAWIAESLGDAQLSNINKLLNDAAPAKRSAIAAEYHKVLEDGEKWRKNPSPVLQGVHGRPFNGLHPLNRSERIKFPPLAIPHGLDLSKLKRNDVLASWSVDEWGEVCDVRIVNSCGVPEIDQLVIDQINAHRHWRVLTDEQGMPIKHEYSDDIALPRSVQ